MYHKGSGRLIYDPRRPGLKNRKMWWAVINVDREITRYYRWWIESQLHTKGMCQPSWDAHISVIRGEKPTPKLMPLWKKYDGKIFEFEYSHSPYRVDDSSNGGSFWMVDVKCEELLDIRRELERPSNWNLHLTVGRTWF